MNEYSYKQDSKKSGRENTQEVNTVLPVDRGWAWLVLSGSALVMCIFIGVMKASGILFVAFQQRFHANSVMTSLLFTVQNAVESFSALFVMTLGVSVTSCRVLVFIGGVIISASYTITAMVDDIRWLLLSYGVLLGIGSACIMPTTLAVLGQYFDKRRGLANTIAVSGGSFGGLVFAPLLTVVLETYGYRGCMLLLAAIHLHLCISAVLFRPESFYLARTKHKVTKLNQFKSDQRERLQSDLDSQKHATDLRKSLLVRKAVTGSLASDLNAEPDESMNDIDVKPRSDSVSVTLGDKTVEVDALLLGSVPCIPGAIETSPFMRRRTHTESSIHRVIKSVSHPYKGDRKFRHTSEYFGGSHMDMSGLIGKKESKNARTSKLTENESNHKHTAIQTLVMIFDTSLLTDPLFLFIETSFMLLCSGSLMCMVFVAPHATDLGIPPPGVAAIVVIYSAIDLVARILIGVLADLHWFRRSTIVGSCAVMTGLASSFLRLYTSFALLITFAVVLGLVSGAFFALSAVVIADYIPAKKLYSVLGYTTLLTGVSVAAGFYTMGLLREMTGSYIVPFYLSAAMNVVGGTLLLLLPVVEKWQKRKSKKTHISRAIHMQQGFSYLGSPFIVPVIGVRESQA